MVQKPKTLGDRLADARRAFTDFLAFPSAVVLGFVLLAIGTYVLDRDTASWLLPTRNFLKRHVAADPQGTSALLGSIASGLITVTSITFSLLLLAVQQSAAMFTSQVLDQFLRRRLNQFYFGAFVGISLYALLILATSNTQVTPVLGTTVTLILTLAAMLLLVLLLYTTLNQMRQTRIVEAIHDLILAARRREVTLVARTRRSPERNSAPHTRDVIAESSGYVTGVDLDRIMRATASARGHPEVTLLVSLGTYVGWGDVVGSVRADTHEDACSLHAEVRCALHLERQRDLRIDSAYGIMQLANIGWTSVSSSKSNPAPGLAAARMLRDLLGRWADQEAPRVPPEQCAPVVYTDDVPDQVVDALESLAVAASESMQHQSSAEVLLAFATVFDRVSPELQEAIERAVLRIISTLGDLVLTAVLDGAMRRLERVLQGAGKTATAAALERAHAQLQQSVGVLNSRATRVPDRG